MTYAEYLKSFVGERGKLQVNECAFTFGLDEQPEDVLSGVFDDYVIVSVFDRSKVPLERAIPISLFSLSKGKR